MYWVIILFSFKSVGCRLSSSRSISLEYHCSLHQSYQKLSGLADFVLLESSDKTRGRYDILSAFAFDRVIIYPTTPNKQELLDSIQNKLTQTTSCTDLPFQGGAIGYISYDLSTYLQGINVVAQASLKDMPLLDLGFYDWAIIVDYQLKKITLFAANQQPTTEEIIKQILNLWASTVPHDKTAEIKSLFKPLIDENKYKNSFAAVSTALQQGRSYQVNLTQPFNATYQGDEWEFYKKITQVNPVPFSCFLKTEQAVLMSFSPERFLLLDKGKITASPIKGTIRRSEDFATDEALKKQLTQCAKNRAENVMIVDLLRNDLGKIAKPGSVQVLNLCAVQSFHSVHHLVSDIEAHCSNQLHPFELFMACFPGGSITGAPKIEAMKIISEQEVFGRGVYCGSIGYFSSHGRFDTNIAIRTITAKEGILHLAAGGGIVIDSNCDDEYEECFTKIAGIVRGLE